MQEDGSGLSYPRIWPQPFTDKPFVLSDKITRKEAPAMPNTRRLSISFSDRPVIVEDIVVDRGLRVAPPLLPALLPNAVVNGTATAAVANL